MRSGWLQAAGCNLAAGCWLLVATWRRAAGCWLQYGCWLLAVDCWLWTVDRWVPGAELGLQSSSLHDAVDSMQSTLAIVPCRTSPGACVGRQGSGISCRHDTVQEDPAAAERGRALAGIEGSPDDQTVPPGFFRQKFPLRRRRDLSFGFVIAFSFGRPLPSALDLRPDEELPGLPSTARSGGGRSGRGTELSSFVLLSSSGDNFPPSCVSPSPPSPATAAPYAPSSSVPRSSSSSWTKPPSMPPWPPAGRMKGASENGSLDCPPFESIKFW
mmetsp:Transcript_15271/g.58057  ORF Transcript_15271/g.58057 Transcript_15271/m.58057 type:complete len:271 (+) Transcript_15271:245-1057(+)